MLYYAQGRRVAGRLVYGVLNDADEQVLDFIPDADTADNLAFSMSFAGCPCKECNAR